MTSKERRPDKHGSDLWRGDAPSATQQIKKPMVTHRTKEALRKWLILGLGTMLGVVTMDVVRQSATIAQSTTNPVDILAPLTDTSTSSSIISVELVPGMKELPHDFTVTDFQKQLWWGEAIRESDNQIIVETIEVAIAYCSSDLNLIYESVLSQVPNQKQATVKITVLSKCGNEADVPNFIEDPRVKQVEVIPLPNVGGCEYAYAYFVNHYVAKTTPEEAASSVVLFTEDTPRTMENFRIRPVYKGYRNITEMLRIASGGEFACGVTPDCAYSAFHDTPTLYEFRINGYARTVVQRGQSVIEDNKDFNLLRYQNLREWHEKALNWTFPNSRVTAVCYAATFMIPAWRILNLSQQPRERHVMKTLEKEMARNVSSSIEGHFSERTWAGFYSVPLDEDHTYLILDMKSKIVLRQGAYHGLLKSNRERMC
jgi:hypothetical protein